MTPDALTPVPLTAAAAVMQPDNALEIENPTPEDESAIRFCGFKFLDQHYDEKTGILTQRWIVGPKPAASETE